MIKWGVFEPRPEDGLPFPEVIPCNEDGIMQLGHIRGMKCRCGPFHDTRYYADDRSTTILKHINLEMGLVS